MNRLRSTHHSFGLQFFTLSQSNEVASGSQLTNRMTPPPIHPVNNLWTGRQAVRFLNFKKWEPDGLIWVPYQKLQKSTKIKNFTSSLLLITDKHCTQQLKCLFYHLITLKTFKNNTMGDIFERKSQVHEQDVRRRTEKNYGREGVA